MDSNTEKRNMAFLLDMPGGQSEKEWKVIDGIRYMIERGSAPYFQEPMNEVFGARIHQKFGYENYVPYSLLAEEKIPGSIHEDFTSVNTEFVSADEINHMFEKKDGYSSYDHFMETCERLEIPGMREFMDYMLVYDFIMGNTGRNFNNFGAIRLVETKEWIGPAPIFDSGKSLWYNQSIDKILGEADIPSGPFGETALQQIDYVSDLGWVRFERLKTLKEDIKEVFTPTEAISEERIETLSNAIVKRVEILQEIEEERRNMRLLFQIY